MKSLADAYRDEPSRIALLNATSISHGTVILSGTAYTACSNIIVAFRDSGKLLELRAAVWSQGHDHIPPLIDDYRQELVGFAAIPTGMTVDSGAKNDAETNQSYLAFLPTLIDRQNTMDTLGVKGRLSMTSLVRERSGQRSAQGALVVVGEDSDRLDDIGDRFAKKDGEKCWLLLKDQIIGHGDWVENGAWQHASYPVTFPDGYDREDCKRRIHEGILALESTKPIFDRSPNHALMITTQILLREHERHIGDITKCWIDVWNNKLQKPTLIPILPILTFLMPNENKSFLGRLTFWDDPEKSALKKYEKIKRRVNVAIGATSSPLLDVAIAPRMRALEEADFNLWVSEHKVETHVRPGDGPKLATMRDEIFYRENKSVRVRMREVYDKINRTGVFGPPQTRPRQQ